MMRRLVGVCAVLLCGSVFAAGAGSVPPLPPELPSLPLPAPLPVPLHAPHGALALRFVNLGQLVDLLYSEFMHVPHVIASDVLQDQRIVSFQWDGDNSELRDFVRVFLDSQGFKVDTRDGVDFVSVKDGSEGKDAERQAFVYHPKYRSAAYLSKLVQPLFSGRVGAQPDAGVPDSVRDAVTAAVGAPVAASGAAASAVSAAAPATRSASLPSSVSAADDLVFYGKPAEVRDLKKVLAELDTAPGEVMVRGWVYEVSNTDATNSAFSIAAHVLDGQLGISNGATSGDATSLTFGAHFLNLAISALSADTRFKEVSDPHVRVLSGEKVSLNVGSQVPTLGSISYQGATGTPVQSVDYQDAGVIFAVEPTVMADAIQVQLDEQISSFVATTTGVNNSPTKNTREMTTTISMHDGEVVVLGGLVQDSDTQSTNHEGWLPHFLDGHSGQKARTEVLLVLQVQKV
ncbi:type II secretion system protein GspD [Paraburkholderia sp. BCC1885]|uniref:type II secretion system protein GspD n=1 Tax=Paraburkholderia sp. BCC1885 TaxID=2562669 RepID=UPI001183EF5D|nr:type II secretory pathway protein [Paraburkholderia sp. BCC1885]